MSNIYQQAAVLKLRFGSERGLLNVENLFDLPLTSKTGMDLDTLAKKVNAELKAQTEESFVVVHNTPVKTELTLKLDILKDVIAFRQEQAKTATEAQTRKAERQQLLAVRENRKLEELQGLSIEEIDKRLAALS